MPARQREPRMVEEGREPATCPVACPTICAEEALVIIVFPMTGITSGGCAQENVINVTSATGHLDMHSG
jgi:hypothetical protein